VSRAPYQTMNLPRTTVVSALFRYEDHTRNDLLMVLGDEPQTRNWLPTSSAQRHTLIGSRFGPDHVDESENVPLLSVVWVHSESSVYTRDQHKITVQLVQR
jgi:hypothetical protein